MFSLRYLEKDEISDISHISKLWLKMLFASLEVNFTISVGMDITNDFAQPNGCDIIIGRGADSGLRDAWN